MEPSRPKGIPSTSTSSRLGVPAESVKSGVCKIGYLLEDGSYHLNQHLYLYQQQLTAWFEEPVEVAAELWPASLWKLLSLLATSTICIFALLRQPDKIINSVNVCGSLSVFAPGSIFGSHFCPPVVSITLVLLSPLRLLEATGESTFEASRFW